MSDNGRMNDDEQELAQNCYGYGRWDAPYWFIGLEEGQPKWENNNFTKRTAVFRRLNKAGLCDCLEFHKEIGEPRWHLMNPKTGRVDGQSTWKYLILLLMAFQETPMDDEHLENILRNYQCNRWGKCDGTGETCVIELSGLPANNSKVSKKRPEETRKQIELIRPTRIESIQKNLLRYRPDFVVMYGVTAKEHWRKIAGVTLQPGIPQKVGTATFLIALHPTAHLKKGQKKNPYWIDLGTRLRAESVRS